MSSDIPRKITMTEKPELFDEAIALYNTWVQKIES
jgi:hypothetical protein